MSTSSGPDAPPAGADDDAAGARPSEPLPATVTTACPYLAAEGRAWRSSAAAREHRCTVTSPPAVLALDKQRRLCLVAEHATCATYIAATAARATRVPAGADPAGRRVTRWAITRTTPVVLDHGRLPALVGTLSPFRRGGQAALGGLMVVAFVAVLVSRLSAPDGRPAGAIGPSVSPTAVASPSVARTATTRPSPTPAPSPSTSPTPAPTPVPTAAPTPVSYTVRTGDTLSAIAARFGTTVGAIVALNGITDPSRLRVGQVLRIPVAAAP